MQQPTIYDVALELARRVGWRNLTRAPLFELAKKRGLVPKDQTESNWCSNLRGVNSLSSLRSRVRNEPGVPEGSLVESEQNRSGAWRDVSKQVILDKAYTLAAEQNKLMVKRSEIAEAAGVSPATVNTRWSGMKLLRLAMVEKARELGNQRLVDQADAIGLTT